MKQPLHLIDLGKDVPIETLSTLLHEAADTDLLRGILQVLRDTAFSKIPQAQDGVLKQNPSWTASQLGAYDALESVALDIFNRAHSEEV